jgi:uncharacterized protein YdaL
MIRTLIPAHRRRGVAGLLLAMAACAAVAMSPAFAASDELPPEPPMADATPAVAEVPATPVRSGTGAPGAGTGTTLVVYDNTGPYGWLGEVDAIQTANLVSHFGSWTAHPVGEYTAGELSGYTSVVYVGSTYDEPLPAAFLDDVTATRIPVLWMYNNIWQLTDRDPDFAATRGFHWKQLDTSPVSQVHYKGTSLTRDPQSDGGIMEQDIDDPAKASAVATAVRADGTTFPWAVRSGNFTYVGEIPFDYVDHDDRYLAFADLLFDLLAPATTERHRALVRIEDVGPNADPKNLRAVADYLYSRKVPFSVAVYPRYRDPKGAANSGRAQDYALADRPEVVKALKYMQARGGTLLMHGYTHQYGNSANPYNGVSAADFEFYRTHVDGTDNVVQDGPITGDSTAWMNGRMSSAKEAFHAAGLSAPTIFEPPHYAASATDYKAITATLGKRYDRGLYFPGVLKGGTVDYSKPTDQFFPYAVRDVYGAAVVPENLGNVIPVGYNNNESRSPADIVASAKRNLVVRDGTASFFYHPYLGTDHLKAIVEGLQGIGYTFVPATAMISG